MKACGRTILAASQVATLSRPNGFSPMKVFLSHDWGIDAIERNNHERVASVNKLLKAASIDTWFDAEEMRGDVKKKMAEGVEGSNIFIAFITQNYLDKASGNGPNGEDDNCYYEFGCALQTKHIGSANMIAVVMEPDCKQTTSWTGKVKGVLGGKLYIDLSDDNFENIQRLVEEMFVRLRNP